MDEVRGDGSCTRGPRKSSCSADGNYVEAGTWRKSSLSFANGNCIEVGTYRKSRHSSGNGQCVEVGAGDGVGVRDTVQEGQPGRTEIEFSPAAWRAFTLRLKTGLT